MVRRSHCVRFEHAFTPSFVDTEIRLSESRVRDVERATVCVVHGLESIDSLRSRRESDCKHRTCRDLSPSARTHSIGCRRQWPRWHG